MSRPSTEEVFLMHFFLPLWISFITLFLSMLASGADLRRRWSLTSLYVRR